MGRYKVSDELEQLWSISGGFKELKNKLKKEHKRIYRRN